MFNNSLISRLLVTVTLLLVTFFGITSFALDNLFRISSRQAINDRLDIQSLALIAATEERGTQLRAVTQLIDGRYLGPNSGLYGQINNLTGDVYWSSPSLLGTKPDFPHGLKPGVRRFDERLISIGSTPSRVLALSVAIEWQFYDGHQENVIYTVAESLEDYYEQLKVFRVRLFSGFAVMSLLLVVAFFIAFRYMLKPLQRIENEIESIETGVIEELGVGYPRELVGVTENMNALLRSERKRLIRYRDTLGNLAHSLKTPLAVMRNLVTMPDLVASASAKQINEQVGHMDQIISYQLKRAAASAKITLSSGPINVSEIIHSINNALQKVYVDRNVQVEMALPDTCLFYADKADMMELIGNVLDNAYKYCAKKVLIEAKQIDIPDSRRQGVQIMVSDDGPGIAYDDRPSVMTRGKRLDEHHAGQGIGLSMVNELVHLYRGSCQISESSLGGACVTIQLLGA